MNTKQIDYILELAQTLNFNKAAENLFISQPTLTYQIKSVEDEIGFRIFERSGKGAMLTAAGAQFCSLLRKIQMDLDNAIGQGRNISERYSENITISLPCRSALPFLPETLKQFYSERPSVLVEPLFISDTMTRLDSFTNGRIDVMFALEDEVKNIDVTVYPLYECHVFVLLKKEDPLAKRELITTSDLKGRTIMISDRMPVALQKVHRNVVRSVQVEYIYSSDQAALLTNVAAEQGISLTLGLNVNDGREEFAYIPFDTPEKARCVLCTRVNERRESVGYLMRLLIEAQRNNTELSF